MGEITVLDNHETYIGVLTKGVMKVTEKTLGSTQAKEYFFEVNSGFLEVRDNNEVRCIIEQ